MSLLYILYTLLIVLGLILLIAALVITRRRRAARNALIAALPVLILIQFYFWNSEFNHYAKSYLFASRAFTCNYEEELGGLSIPLPRRTVFLAREDACSPFYLTYVDGDQFKAFYGKELAVLKKRGEAADYRYDERKDRYGTEYKEYLVDLASGSRIAISYRNDAGDGFITIVSNPEG